MFSGFIARANLADLWDRARSGFWLLPSAMTLFAAGLAFALVALDGHLRGLGAALPPWLAGVESGAAQAILATIASSMITVAGVSFSITIVALQLASTQFGPRLLRTFMVDTGNQVVLGAFIANFLYCLIVLGAVRGDAGFVPHYAFAVGVVSGIANVGVLIYFIHHMASEVRVENVIESLAHELYGSLDDHFSDDRANAAQAGTSHAALAIDFDDDGLAIAAQADGYVRHVNEAELTALAAAHDLVVRLEGRPGEFVVDSDILLVAAPAARAGDVADRLRDCVALGPTRTPLQDPIFAQQQLVEIGVRALSAAFNDPFTAAACIDRLGQGLCRFARRKPLSPCRLDETGAVRIIQRPVTLREMAEAGFQPLVRAGRTHFAVGATLIRVILLVAGSARSSADRAFLIKLARQVHEDCQSALASAWDKEELAQLFARQMTRLRGDRSRDETPGEPHPGPPTDLRWLLPDLAIRRPDDR